MVGTSEVWVILPAVHSFQNTSASNPPVSSTSQPSARARSSSAIPPTCAGDSDAHQTSSGRRSRRAADARADASNASAGITM